MATGVSHRPTCRPLSAWSLTLLLLMRAGTLPRNDRSRWRLRTWRMARPVLIAYLLVLLVLTFFERSLLFPAMRYPAGDWEAARRYGFEDVWFHSPDGTRLHGWLAEHESPQGALLFCHGNAGNVTHRAEIMNVLRRRLRMTVFVFDYRGYGRSEGCPDEPGTIADARAARDWLARRVGMAPEELVLMGRSMGGSIATRLASEDGARGLILENTFTSAADVGADVFPFLPVRLLMRNRFETLSHIGAYQGPLFVSHGTADDIVPFSDGERLFAAATTPTKEFVPIPGAGHNDWPESGYYDSLAEFLESSLEMGEQVRR